MAYKISENDREVSVRELRTSPTVYLIRDGGNCEDRDEAVRILRATLAQEDAWAAARQTG